MWNEAHAAPGSDTSMPVWRQQQGQMFATLSSPQQAIPMQQQVHAQPAASNGFWAQFGLGPAAPAWQALAQLRSRVLGDNGFQGPVSASNHAEQAPAPMVRDAWSMLELRRRRGERDRTADLMGILDSLAPSPAGLQHVTDWLMEARRGLAGAPQGQKRTKAIASGRTQLDVLQAVVDRVRTTVSGPRNALEDAKGFAVVTLSLPFGRIQHANSGLADILGWLGSQPSAIEGHMLPSLVHPSDGENFRRFLAAIKQSNVRGGSRGGEGDACKPGGSIYLRLLCRPISSSFRAPGWMLVQPIHRGAFSKRNLKGIYRTFRQVYSKPIRFVLSLVQAKALGDPENVVLVADLHGAVPSEVGIYAAHVRNLMDTGLMNRTYDVSWEERGMDPIEVFMAIRWMVPSASSLQLRESAVSSIAAACRRLKTVTNFVLRKVVALRITLSYRLDENDVLVLSSEEQFSLGGGARFCTSELAVVGQREDSASPDDSRSKTNGGVDESNPSPNKTQLVFVVSDVAQELDSCIRFVYFGMQGSQVYPFVGGVEKYSPRFRCWAKVLLQYSDSIICEVDHALCSPQSWFFSTQIDMPWSLGDRADQFRAHGKTVTATDGSGGTIDSILARFRSLLQPSTSHTKVDPVQHSRGVWVVDGDSTETSPR